MVKEELYREIRWKIGNIPFRLESWKGKNKEMYYYVYKELISIIESDCMIIFRDKLLCIAVKHRTLKLLWLFLYKWV